MTFVRTFSVLLVLVVIIGALVGCGGGGTSDVDAGSGTDSGTHADSGSGADSGTHVDAGGGTDAGSSADAGTDAGTSSDSGTATDAGAAVDAGSATDGGDVVICAAVSGGTFPAFDKNCAGDADCVFGVHQTNCCGDSTAIGFNASEQTRFDADEAVCDAMYPGCGCPAHPTVAEDGRHGTITVSCDTGMCTTHGSAP